MYLEHFKFNEMPFSLTPNTNFYCDLPTHKEALNVLLLGLKQGEGFLKIIGEVGTGKTLLCRLLLNNLDASFVTAYIPNPDQNSQSLRTSLAYELGLSLDQNIPQHLLLEQITQCLLQIHQSGKQAILIIDEAQALPDDCLEAIRLLTNLETEEKKLLQVVLFGQPELDVKLNQHHLRQLKQRITFAYSLKSLTKAQMELYLCHRLARAGYTYGMIFSTRAKKLLFKASRGLPRLLNILSHKALLDSYGRGLQRVDAKAIKCAIKDTESIMGSRRYYLYGSSIILILLTCITYVFYRNIQ